jgi:hypothetical protein
MVETVLLRKAVFALEGVLMKWIVLVLLLLLTAACQPAEPQGELPTLAVLPSATPTDEPTATETLTNTPFPTDTPLPTETPTDTPTPTDTLMPSRTPRATATATLTTEPTFAAIASGTAAVQEAPRFSTLTPLPAGTLPPATPLVAADVIITEPQFQEEVNARIPNIPSIETARVNFVPDGISVELTASGGEALLTGRVLVTIILTGDFATISIGDIEVNAPEAPQAYLDLVAGDFFLMMLESLDSILKERLGPDQNLQSIVVTDSAIEVMLLVPEQ